MFPLSSIRILLMDSRATGPLLDHLTSLNDLRSSEKPAVSASAASGSTMLSRLAYQLNTDEELVAKLRAGETDALTVLFQRHSVLVFRIARRILRDDTEGEDVVQQVFFDLFRSVAKFDPAKGTFKVWLLMYAYHRALNHRRNLRAAHYYEIEDMEQILRDYSIVEKRRPFPFQATEAAYLVREALEQIQPRQREVIELVYYEGCTAEEIAERTGDSAHVVRHNLYRGMKKANSILQNLVDRT
jgi:RNA polymerase sigma-70 factor (ECF subfamily)